MGSTFLSRILIKRFVVPLSLTLAAAFYALFPFSGGEDVNNATQNFQSSERNNFWGGLAPWFYSLFPDSILGSDTLYALLYLLLIGVGTGLFQKYLCAKNHEIKVKINHLAENTQSYQFSKSIIDGTAKGVYQGKNW